MTQRDLTSTTWARVVLGVSVLALLSAGMCNVLLAVTASVWWPLMLGVVWLVIAGAVVVAAESATLQIENAPRGTGAGGRRSSSSSRVKYSPPPSWASVRE